MINVLWILLSAVLEFIIYLVHRYFEERIIRRDNYIKWKAWKKHNTNNPIYKLFVLFGWRHSPSLECYVTIRDYEASFHREGYTLATTYYKDVHHKKGDR